MAEAVTFHDLLSKCQTPGSSLIFSLPLQALKRWVTALMSDNPQSVKRSAVGLSCSAGASLSDSARVPHQAG